VAGAERADRACERGRRLSDPANLWGGADYDAIAPYYAPIYDDLIARLAPRQGERFLDVATGTGEVALRAARAGADVVGIDIAPKLLDVACAKPGAEAIRFDVGDARSLPYDDATFDVVASNFGIIFVPEPERVAGELARVTRPDGRLGVTAWHRKPRLSEIYERFGRTSSVDSDAWADPGEAERLLGDAFELSRHERTWNLEGESGESLFDFWSNTAPPTKAYLAELDDETRAQVRAALVEYWEGFRDGDGVREPRDYVLILGRRR
jgi:SAM-dependent methyltransferase